MANINSSHVASLSAFAYNVVGFLAFLDLNSSLAFSFHLFQHHLIRRDLFAIRAAYKTIWAVSVAARNAEEEEDENLLIFKMYQFDAYI